MDTLPKLLSRLRSDEHVEAAWSTEIIRRAERAIAGESIGRDADEVLDAIEAKLRRQ